MISRALAGSVLAALLTSGLGFAQQATPPKILFDTSPRAIEFQLSRLSNAELALVDRNEGDVKYRPVYSALLTRKGMGREFFDEALDALTKLDKTSRARVLLEALGRVRANDTETIDRLLKVLLAQPADALRKEREIFAASAKEGGSAPVLRAAYGAMMLADGDPGPAWKAASSRDGHLPELLRSVPHLGQASKLPARLAEPVTALLEGSPDTLTRAAALAALGWSRPDASSFRLLAQAVLTGADPEVRAAAVASLLRIPADAWPAGEIEPLARAIVSNAGKSTPQQRTEPGMLEEMQLAEKLAAALPDEPRRAIRRDLRDLGVRVVRIQTVPEQMAFDVRWFAVEAGKPVQIVLFNPDAMSHNLLVTMPGALREVGTAASTMTLPTDPKAKPYVPDTPLVLQATRLLNWGETERLSFTAPKEPGEYPFVCTFPGHWVRMYGVMLVVPNLEQWEANRTVPKDPMTDKPFGSERNDAR